MWWYLLKRLGLSIAIVLLAVSALFAMLHSIPGDPVSIALGPRATPEIQAAYAAKMHLDKPLAYQFLIFMGNVLRGDLGVDVFSNRSVAQTMSDGKTVRVGVPEDLPERHYVAYLDSLLTQEVETDNLARVVINERTGTVTMGGAVRLRPGVIAHGSIFVTMPPPM